MTDKKPKCEYCKKEMVGCNYPTHEDCKDAFEQGKLAERIAICDTILRDFLVIPSKGASDDGYNMAIAGLRAWTKSVKEIDLLKSQLSKDEVKK